MMVRRSGEKTKSGQNGLLIRVLAASFVLLAASLGVVNDAHARGAIAIGAFGPGDPVGIVGDEVDNRLDQNLLVKMVKIM